MERDINISNLETLVNNLKEENKNLKESIETYSEVLRSYEHKVDNNNFDYDKIETENIKLVGAIEYLERKVQTIMNNALVEKANLEMQLQELNLEKSYFERDNEKLKGEQLCKDTKELLKVFLKSDCSVSECYGCVLDCEINGSNLCHMLQVEAERIITKESEIDENLIF